MKSRIQESESRIQNGIRPQNRIYRFSFLLTPDFWLLTPDSCILLFIQLTGK